MADSDIFNIVYMNAFDGACQDQVLRNVSLYTKAPNGEMIPPADVTSHVCPNQCSLKGTCNAGVCVCQHGFEGDDCSVNTAVPPTISHIRGFVKLHREILRTVGLLKSTDSK